MKKKWVVTVSSPFVQEVDRYGIESENEPTEYYDDFIDESFEDWDWESDDTGDDDASYEAAYDAWVKSCNISLEVVDEFPSNIIIYE